LKAHCTLIFDWLTLIGLFSHDDDDATDYLFVCLFVACCKNQSYAMLVPHPAPNSAENSVIWILIDLN